MRLDRTTRRSRSRRLLSIPQSMRWDRAMEEYSFTVSKELNCPKTTNSQLASQEMEICRTRRPNTTEDIDVRLRCSLRGRVQHLLVVGLPPYIALTGLPGPLMYSNDRMRRHHTCFSVCEAKAFPPGLPFLRSDIETGQMCTRALELVSISIASRLDFCDVKAQLVGRTLLQPFLLVRCSPLGPKPRTEVWSH